MAKVFISYSSSDSIFADLTKMKLKEAGIQVWLDSGELRAGEEWRDAIDKGISSMDVMIVVLTPQSCESPYVTYEWGFALGKGKTVIPILLKSANVHPRLDVFQYLDFRDHNAFPWSQLISEISESASKSKSNNSSAYVRDMTSADLQEIIAGAIALSNATQKSTGQLAKPEDISRAADSVVDAVKRYSYSKGKSIPKQILWVDDRPDNNVYERDAFESVGYNFVLALSTDAALNILKKQSFVAIISDMGRKEGPREGYVLLDAIRNQGNETPFFIYAGSNAPEHKAEAARHGAQGSTNNPQELFDLVSQHVS